MYPDRRSPTREEPVNFELDRLSRLIDQDLMSLQRSIDRQVEAEMARRSLLGWLRRWLGTTSQINVHEDYEVAYWTHKFGVSKDDLEAAVLAVGTEVKRVQEHLGVGRFTRWLGVASRVNVHEDYEVEYWTHKLGVTRAELEAAVLAVGTEVKRVQEHLGK